MTPAASQEEATRILRVYRRRALARQAGHERELQAAFAAASAAIADRLSLGTPSHADVRRVVSEELTKAGVVTSRLVASGTSEAASDGATAAAATVGTETTTGDHAAAVATGVAATRARRVLRGRTVSERLVANIGVARDRAASELSASNEAATDLFAMAAALAFLAPGSEPDAKVREMATRAARAKREADVAHYRDVIDRQRHGVFAVAAAGLGFAAVSRRLTRELEAARLGATRDIATRWADRSFVQARTMSRNEAVAGFSRGYSSRLATEADVIGYRWNLSTFGKHCSVCVGYADEDGYGLGPGGFPVASVPDHPHVNCGCFQVAILASWSGAIAA